MKRRNSEGNDGAKCKVILDGAAVEGMTVVTCPICNRQYQSAKDIDVFVSRHIDRCTRRSAPTVTYSTEESDVVLSDDEPRCKVDSSFHVDVLSDDGELDDFVAPEHESADEDTDADVGGAKKQKISNDITSGRVKEEKHLVEDDWETTVYLDRIDKCIEEGLNENIEIELNTSSSTSFGNRGNLGNFQVPRTPWELFHEYQREGVRWMWNLMAAENGGILGDEMGLGKTAQTCMFFGAISQTRRMETVRNKTAFLILCPATVLQHWLKEMRRWNPMARAVILHPISSTFAELQGLSQRATQLALEDILSDEASKHGVIVITTYDTFKAQRTALLAIEWTACCLDEGQKIRNPLTSIANFVKMLQSPNRFILSGTPVQNNLKELWSLFDFVCPGILGSLQAFETEFATPIRQGGYANATKLQAEVAVRTAATLQRMLKPYLLRRKKDDVSLNLQLPEKTEQILFCKLSDCQKTIYKDILRSPEVEAVLDRRMAAFKAITTLRKLCNHPALVFVNGKFIWSVEDEIEDIHDSLEDSGLVSKERLNHDTNSTKKQDETNQVGPNVAITAPVTIKVPIVQFSWEHSGKLLVLSTILHTWHFEGHKVLIFSQTQSMLNLIEVMVKQLCYKYMRLDGSTPVSRREGIISTFNSDESIFVMLLTTRTGGVGISLTSANRVIIIDPDWNPQTDIQARERSWRLGQKKSVTIYRLITKGTIEEKIYRRQIFKELLSNRILENPKQKRFFSSTSLHELFEFTDDDDSEPGEVNLPASGTVHLDVIEDEAQILSKSTSHDDKELEDGEVTESFRLNEDAEDYVIKGDVEESEIAKDRKLLKALFDGEAISAVYDHSFFEMDKAIDRRSIEDGAKQIVDNAVQHLRSSVFSSTDFDGQRVRFGSQSLSGGGQSSANLLNRIRDNRESHDLQAFEIGSNSNVLARLKRMFMHSHSSYTTTEILSQFNDVEDQYAAVFRDILRSVAKFHDGKWIRR